MSSSERPKFWVRGFAENFKACQVHRVRLSRILVYLDDSEGRVAVYAEAGAEDSSIYSPSGDTARLTDRAESLLVVKMAIASIKSDPVDEVVRRLEPPARHNVTFLHERKISYRVARGQ